MWFHMVWHTFFFSTFQLPFVLPERTVSDHLSKFQAPSGTPPVEILEYIFIYCLFYPAFLFGAEIFSSFFFQKRRYFFVQNPKFAKSHGSMTFISRQKLVIPPASLVHPSGELSTHRRKSIPFRLLVADVD